MGTLWELAIVKRSTTFKEGDLVLIRDYNVKGFRRPKVKLLKMHKARDGPSRVMKLKSKTGEFLRPCQCLCLLEIRDENYSKHLF